VDWVLELAENANTYTPLAPADERIDNDRFVLWMGPVDEPWANVAQRFRLRPAEIDQAREEIHSLLRANGRTACTWEVGSHATPEGLVDRLLALGLVDDQPTRVRVPLDFDFDWVCVVEHDRSFDRAFIVRAFVGPPERVPEEKANGGESDVIWLPQPTQGMLFKNFLPWAFIFLHFLKHCAIDVGDYKRRRNGIDPDVLRSKVHGHLSG